MSSVAAVCHSRGRIGIVETPTCPATVILSGSENHSCSVRSWKQLRPEPVEFLYPLTDVNLCGVEISA